MMVENLLVKLENKSKADNMNIYGKLLRLNHYLPIITVNINGLNSPIKRDWLNVLKTRPIYL